jgi:peptidyl-prolyl cis-trans isomerase C
VVVGVVSAACGARVGGTGSAHTKLGGQVAGRVGEVDIEASTVAAVARERSVSPEVALGLLLDDVVLAKAALARGMGTDPDIALGRATALARVTVERARLEAQATPPTDAEVESATAAHWVDLDRPETFVVVHAIAMRPKKPDPGAEAAAKAVAASIAAVEVEAKDEADFEARAKAVPAGGVEVRVEHVGPFTADGRGATPGGEGAVVASFAAGAAGIPAAGGTTGVVETNFGWHVIRLLERRPAHVAPAEERRRALTDEIYVLRERRALAALQAAFSLSPTLTVTRAARPVTLANGVDDLLAEALPAVRSREAAAAPSAP